MLCESVMDGWVQKFVEVARSIFGSLVHLCILEKFRVKRSRL